MALFELLEITRATAPPKFAGAPPPPIAGATSVPAASTAGSAAVSSEIDDEFDAQNANPTKKKKKLSAEELRVQQIEAQKVIYRYIGNIIYYSCYCLLA